MGSSWEQELRLPAPGTASALSVQWSQRLDGLVAELAFADQSGDVLISMIPDPENKVRTRLKKPGLELWDAQGKKLWRHDLKVQSRLISLSGDGAWIAVQSHLEELTLLSRTGRKIWSRKTSCRPIFVSQASFLICHHDDAAEPATALDFLSLKDGKVLASYSHPRDPLAVRISKDGQTLAVAFSGGLVEVFSLQAWLQNRTATLKPYRSLQVVGEVTDLVFVAGEVWVLHGAARKNPGQGEQEPGGHSQRLTRWLLAPVASGEAPSSRPASESVERVEMLGLKKVFRQLEPFDRGVWLYANGAGEQSVLRVEADGASGLKPTWLRSLKGASEYSSQVRDLAGDALVGVEWAQGSWASALVLLSPSGDSRWSLSITDPEVGGLLYTHAVASGRQRRVVAASDSGRLWFLEAQSSAGP